MKNLRMVCFAAVALVSSLSPLAADEKAEKILEKARFASTLQVQDLSGHLRKDGKRTPIRLFLRKENIQFQFYDGKKWNVFHMRLKQGGGQLFEIVNKKTIPFSKEKLSQQIMGTDFTYEDLSMNFLYWKNAQVVKQETIKLQKCDVLRLRNPGNGGNYAMVYASIHQKAGALMKVLGTDANNKVVKQFAIDKLMTVGKQKTLQRMKVQSYDPKTEKRIGVTYLEFQEPKFDDDPL